MNKTEAVNLIRSGQSGVEAWNASQRGSSRVAPGWDFAHENFIGANLKGIDFAGASLSCSNFSRANLARANMHMGDLRSTTLSNAILNNAHITEADLTNANLSDATLHQANLSGSNFRNADLSNADLTSTNLKDTNFTRVSLVKANFTEAISNGTIWTDLDLSQAKGLEDVKHTGPSLIDFNTFLKSRAKIPNAFLRGCGVPQTFIDYLPSLISALDPIQFYSCFISHSSNDKEFCRRLHARMEQEKLRVWFDEKDMKGGRKIHDQIIEAIRVYDKLLLIISPDSMKSEWVKTEIYQAYQKERQENRQVLFPIRLCDFEIIRQWQCFDADTGKDLARDLREYYIPGDFQNWKDHDAFETAFAKLLEDLRASKKPKS